MAENEILDVGNRRSYKRWRQALADANVSPASVADCLSEEFLPILQRRLRRGPLYLVLKACGQDRKVLQEAINGFKERYMAKLVEKAYAITRSDIPLVVADKIAELLVDDVVDRANKYAFKHDHNANHDRHAALEHATYARLKACKPQILGVLAASLRGEPIRRVRGAPRARVSAQALNSLSLSPRKPGEKRTDEPPNVV